MQRESSSALGQGLRLGFLGTLHMDVFKQRLEDEYDANIIITAPTVPYKGIDDAALRFSISAYSCSTVIYRDKTEIISNPTNFPDVVNSWNIVEVQEPVVNASIIVPQGKCMKCASLLT